MNTLGIHESYRTHESRLQIVSSSLVIPGQNACISLVLSPCTVSSEKLGGTWERD